MSEIGSSTIAIERLYELEAIEKELEEIKKENCLFVCDEDKFYYFPRYSKITIPDAMIRLKEQIDKLQNPWWRFW